MVLRGELRYCKIEEPLDIIILCRESNFGAPSSSYLYRSHCSPCLRCTERRGREKYNKKGGRCCFGVASGLLAFFGISEEFFTEIKVGFGGIFEGEEGNMKRERFFFLFTFDFINPWKLWQQLCGKQDHNGAF